MQRLFLLNRDAFVGPKLVTQQAWGRADISPVRVAQRARAGLTVLENDMRAESPHQSPKHVIFPVIHCLWDEVIGADLQPAKLDFNLKTQPPQAGTGLVLAWTHASGRQALARKTHIFTSLHVSNNP